MTETKFDPHQEQLKAKDEMIDYYKEQIEDLEMDRDSLKRMNDDMQEVLDKIVKKCKKNGFFILLLLLKYSLIKFLT